MNTYRICPNCQWRAKVRFSIWKRARRRYKRQLNKYEHGLAWVTKPKELVPHIESCKNCFGTGLVESQNFPEIHPDYPHVVIIWWGIGWTALALACKHRGIPYTLYERDESFDARAQWYGLTLQQASKAIEWLGIFELASWITSTMHIVHDTSWKVIGKWGMRKWLEWPIRQATKRRNIHISRQSLRAELLSGFWDENSIAWGYTLKNISKNTQWNYDLEFQVWNETQIWQADLIVWADGIRSTTRKLIIGDTDAPLQYLWCIVMLGICPLERLGDTQSPLLDGKTVFQTVNGHERIYMMPYDADTIMWQLSFPLPEQDAIKLSRDGPEALKREGIRRLQDWHSPVPEILSATETSRISGYPVYDRVPADLGDFDGFWAITLLWDAMHPMSPFKWQWANQALLDALDLARDVTTKCHPDSNWREQWLRNILLKDFEKNMLQRATPKVRESAKQAALLHSDAVLHEGDNPRGRGISEK